MPTSLKGIDRSGSLKPGVGKVVLYSPDDDANYKRYELSGGPTVWVLHLKSLQYLLRETPSPFDALVISNSFETSEELHGLPHVLELHYVDTEKPRRGDGFTPQLAATVASFLESHPEVRQIGFCCNAGISRSPAMAAAFMRHLGYQDDCIWGNPFCSPNTLVYQRLMAVWDVEVSDEERVALKRRNEQALERKIRNTQLPECGLTIVREP